MQLYTSSQLLKRFLNSQGNKNQFQPYKSVYKSIVLYSKYFLIKEFGTTFFLKEKVSSSPITPLQIFEWLPVTLLRKSQCLWNVPMTAQQQCQYISLFGKITMHNNRSEFWLSFSYIIFHFCHSTQDGSSCPLGKILISELILKICFIC